MSKRRKQTPLTGMVLWVDGKRAGNSSFVPSLRKKGVEVATFSTGKSALASLKKVNPDVIVVDASSFRTSGVRICHIIRDAVVKLPVILIANPNRPVSGDEQINVILNLPFTIRKLVNRISPFLPITSNNLVRAGEIELDLDRNHVRCKEQESQLTPRLKKLLLALMEQPGIVFDARSFSRRSGTPNIQGILALWTFISAGFERLLRSIRANLNT